MRLKRSMLALALASALAMLTGTAFADDVSDVTTTDAVDTADVAETDVDSEAGFTPEQSAAIEKYGDLQKLQFRALRESAEPRDWAIAALTNVLDQKFEDASARSRAELLRNAAAAAPDDALLQWLALTRMPNTSGGCSASTLVPESVSALLRVDDSNALAWIPVLGQANNANDGAAIDATLARMAAAPRLDQYGPKFENAVLDALRRHADVDWSLPFAPSGVSVETQHFAQALLAGNSVEPSYYVVHTVCDANEQSSADFRRFASCGDFGRRLAHEGTTVEARTAGFEILRASGQLDANDEIDEGRVLWQQSKLNELMTDPAVFDRFRVAWVKTQDDTAAAEIVLRANGIALDPPPGWVALQKEEARIATEAAKAAYEAEMGDEDEAEAETADDATTEGESVAE